MSWISARKSGNAAWNIANNVLTPSLVGDIDLAIGLVFLDEAALQFLEVGHAGCSLRLQNWIEQRPRASRPRRCGGGGAEAGVSYGPAPLGSLGWVSAVPPTACSQGGHNASIHANNAPSARTNGSVDTVRVRPRRQ